MIHRRVASASATKTLDALLLGQGTQALDDFAIRVGECEDLRDLRIPLHSVRDLSSVSVRLDLLVAPARTNRKQAHSNASRLERYDAAVLQGVDELGQVRKQRSRQCLRFPATLAAELDDRRLSRGTHREQGSEISIRGHNDSMLGGSVLEDHFVVGVLQS
jgi:hypothetical protein